MEIYALYGPSGTGKSTSALALAHKHHISAIIDDGLLIFQGQKIAGTSAKYEKTTVQAVKRAIFFYPDHAKEVKETLSLYPIDRLLILGTSRKMISRIQEALELPVVDHYVYIADIRSSAEIKAALFDRETGGRHVIPIPRLQVEQDFVSRLIAKVNKIFSHKKEEIGETTIVHPHFHSGKIHVSETVLKKLVTHSCGDFPFIRDIHRIKVDITEKMRIEVDLRISLELEESLKDMAYSVQKSIYQAFVNHLNLEVEQIRVYISQVSITTEKKEKAISSH
ncbi:MAG TPA: hypothetical protein VJ824_10400 [Bacillota bacterium]|nr:hypothetical protein [Bacillota bacterium]